MKSNTMKISKDEYLRRCKILGIEKIDFLSTDFIPVDIENYTPPFKGGKTVYKYSRTFAISADGQQECCSCGNQYCSGPCCVCERDVHVMVNGPDMDTYNKFYK